MSALDLLAAARRRRGLHLAIVQLRLLIGFALLPAGLKKVLGQPFTDPGNAGVFHDFLDAFHATGGFYTFVGVGQLIAAALLLTQRFAAAGAVLALPIITAILVFCWSTGVVPTAIVVTLMWLATMALVLWDGERWRGLVAADDAAIAARTIEPAAWIDRRLWALCGTAIAGLYLAACAVTGEVYRPRGFEPTSPVFWLLHVLPLLPVATWLVDRRRHRARQSRPGSR